MLFQVLRSAGLKMRHRGISDKNPQVEKSSTECLNQLRSTRLSLDRSFLKEFPQWKTAFCSDDRLKFVVAAQISGHGKTSGRFVAMAFSIGSEGSRRCRSVIGRNWGTRGCVCCRFAQVAQLV